MASLFSQQKYRSCVPRDKTKAPASNRPERPFMTRVGYNITSYSA
jgi:hypothetical protein